MLGTVDFLYKLCGYTYTFVTLPGGYVSCLENAAFEMCEMNEWFSTCVLKVTE